MISESKILDHAHQVLRSEAEDILAIDNHLDDSFVKAVELILKKVRTFSWTFFTIHELQKSCVSIPEKLSDVVSSYQARTSEFPQEEFLRRGALSW